MKKILLVLFMILSINCFARENNTLENSLLNISSLSASFIQTNNLKDFGEDIYKGNVYIIMKDKALWDYSSPYKSWYIFTKDSIIQYDEINNQTIEFNADEARENVLLQVILDITSIKKNFSSKQLNKETIRFIPKKDYGIKYIDVTFKDNIINSLASIDKAGNETTIQLNNVKLNQKINEKVFKKKELKNK